MATRLASSRQRPKATALSIPRGSPEPNPPPSSAAPTRETAAQQSEQQLAPPEQRATSARSSRPPAPPPPPQQQRRSSAAPASAKQSQPTQYEAQPPPPFYTSPYGASVRASAGSSPAPQRATSARSFAVAAHKRPPSVPPPSFAASSRAPSAGPSSGPKKKPAPLPRRSRPSATHARRPSHSASARNVTHDEESSASQSKVPRSATVQPSRPPTAYALYREEVRPYIADEAATVLGASFNIPQVVQQRWAALSPEEKKPYEEEAARRAAIYESTMEEWKTLHPEAHEASRESRRKRNIAASSPLPDDPELASAPLPPLRAFELYATDASHRTPAPSAKALSREWRALSDEAKQTYFVRATQASAAYEAAYAGWKRKHPNAAIRLEAHKASTKKGASRTVSDDEAEYAAEVAKHGSELRGRRLDPASVSMNDLSGTQFGHGRASDRTYQSERLLRNMRQQAERRRRFERKYGYSMTEEAPQPQPDPSIARATPSSAADVAASDVEEVIDGVSGGEEIHSDEEGQSDAESVGAASSAASTAPPLRERKFAVRTRMVNGQIVIDESSLQQSRNESAGYGPSAGEAIDINESERFINSATYAKPRVRSERWTALETQRFLEAVSMWGSDFEMIARMFPRRDRKQIRGKWRAMEKTDSRSLDLAFRRKLPVNLDSYGKLAGADLSGEAAPIEANHVIKKMEDDEEEGEGREHDVDGDIDGAAKREASAGGIGITKVSPAPPAPRIEYDDEGREIVEEGDDDDDDDGARGGQGIAETQQQFARLGSLRSRRGSSPSATPGPPRSERGTSVASATSTGPPAIVASSASRAGAGAGTGTGETGRRGRSGSAASMAAASGAGSSAHPAAAAAAGAHGASAAAATDRVRRQKREREEQRAEREKRRRYPAVSGDEEEVLD